MSVDSTFASSIIQKECTSSGKRQRTLSERVPEASCEAVSVKTLRTARAAGHIQSNGPASGNLRPI